MQRKTTAPVTFYIANLPDAYGYGVVGYGSTPEEAERACKMEYFRNGRHGEGSGWQHQPWKVAKEEWGFSIVKATTGKAHLEGCGDYVVTD